MMRRLAVCCAALLCVGSALAEITGVFALPEGSSGAVQFEKDGYFGGDSDFTFSSSTNRLSVSSASVTFIDASTVAVRQIRWADGTVQTSSPTAGGMGSGDAVLAATQSFTGINTFGQTVKFKGQEPFKDVTAWGAAGDGASTDTASIQSALDGGGNIYFPAGVYLSSAPLSITSNTYVKMSPEAIIKASIRTWTDRGIFEVSGATNVVIEGGVLDGDKANNPTGRVVGVFITGAAKGVTVRDLVARNMPGLDAAGTNGGDGIMLGASGSTPENVTIDNVTFSSNTRQGISVITGRYIRIVNSHFEVTTGTSPGYGIDLEPNVVGDTLEDVLVANNSFTGNVGGAVMVASKVDGPVAIVGNVIRGGSEYGGSIHVSGPHVTVSGNTIYQVKNHGIYVSQTTGTIVSDNAIYADGSSTNRSGVTIVDSTGVVVDSNYIKGTFSAGVFVDQASLGSVSSKNITISNNVFYDCVAPGGTATFGAITIQASGGGKYAQNISIVNNQIFDTRSGTDRADYGIHVTADASDTRAYVHYGNQINNTEGTYYGFGADQGGKDTPFFVRGATPKFGLDNDTYGQFSMQVAGDGLYFYKTTTELARLFSGGLDLQQSVGGSAHLFRLWNTSDTASSDAAAQIVVGGSSAGDPYARFQVAGVTAWSLGLDNSDSDKFKISHNNTLGTNDRLTIDSAGVISGNGNGLTGISTASLNASGTPNATTFLRGDNTWAAPAGSGDAVLAATQTWTGTNNFKWVNTSATSTFNAAVTVNGNLTSTGTVTGNIFSGSGAGLTAVPASSIASGSLGSQVIASSIAVNAVTTATIASGVITAAKMANADHGDVSWSGGVATVDNVAAANVAAGNLGASVRASSVAASAVGSNQIADDSIVNADINSSAAIAISKLATSGSLGASVIVSSIAQQAVYANALASTDSPGDNEVPTYDAATGKVTWEADQTAAGGGDNLGSHVATMTISAPYGISASTISFTGSSDPVFYSTYTKFRLQLTDTSDDDFQVFESSAYANGSLISTAAAIGATIQGYDATLADLAAAPLGEADSISVGAVAAGILPSDVQASSVSAGTVGLLQLSATGSPSASNFLRGDNTWAAPAGTGDAVLAATQTWTGTNNFAWINTSATSTFNAAVTVNTNLTSTGTVAAARFAGTSGTSVMVLYPTSATINSQYVLTASSIGATGGVQAYDADLDDLADGSLTGSKVGDGVPAANIAAGALDTDVRVSSIAHQAVYAAALASTDAPGDNEVPTYDLATGKFTWEADQTAAGGGDNLGNHTATMTVTANYGISASTISVSTITNVLSMTAANGYNLYHATIPFTVVMSSGVGWNGQTYDFGPLSLQGDATITKIDAVALPLGTTVLFQFDETTLAGAGAAGTDVFSVSYATATSPGVSYTSFSNATITAGSSLVLTTHPTAGGTGSPASIRVTVWYKEN